MYEQELSGPVIVLTLLNYLVNYMIMTLNTGGTFKSKSSFHLVVYRYVNLEFIMEIASGVDRNKNQSKP